MEVYDWGVRTSLWLYYSAWYWCQVKLLEGVEHFEVLSAVLFMVLVKIKCAGYWVVMSLLGLTEFVFVGLIVVFCYSMLCKVCLEVLFGEGVNDWCIVLKSFSDWLYALGYPILWIDLSLIRCNLVIGGLCLLMLYQMVVL